MDINTFCWNMSNCKSIMNNEMFQIITLTLDDEAFVWVFFDSSDII